MHKTHANPGAPDGSPILPVTASGVRLSRGGRLILDIAQLSLPVSGITCLIGPNGSGKTALIRVLAGLVQPGAGNALWAGRKPDAARIRRFGFMPQSPVFLRRSALENLMFPLMVAGSSRAQARKAATLALGRAGLAELASTSARLMSGGEKQRLAFVRTLALDPQILILDEPCANLDPASTLAIERMIGATAAAGTPVVLVTHDLVQARRLAEHVIFMHQGRIVEESGAGRFFDAPKNPLAAAFVAGELLVSPASKQPTTEPA